MRGRPIQRGCHATGSKPNSIAALPTVPGEQGGAVLGLRGIHQFRHHRRLLLGRLGDRRQCREDGGKVGRRGAPGAGCRRMRRPLHGRAGRGGPADHAEGHREPVRAGHTSSPMPTPTGRASNPTRSTASASTRPSCGEARPSRKRPFTSISGSAISSQRLPHGASHERLVPRPRSRPRTPPSRCGVARVAALRALESLLVEKGLISSDPSTRSSARTSRTSARVTEPRWSRGPGSIPPNGPAAGGRLGRRRGAGVRRRRSAVVENTPEVHNLVVCTLCPCYPSALLGLPPVWYKSFAYRSRAVLEPRAVLRGRGRP